MVAPVREESSVLNYKSPKLVITYISVALRLLRRLKKINKVSCIKIYFVRKKNSKHRHSITHIYQQDSSTHVSSVADPGFPRGGGVNPKGGAPTYYLANFSRKLHENEEILGKGGPHVPRAPPPLDAPLSVALGLLRRLKKLVSFMERIAQEKNVYISSFTPE